MQILANCICTPSQGTSPYTGAGLYWTYYLSHQLQEKWKEEEKQLDACCYFCKCISLVEKYLKKKCMSFHETRLHRAHVWMSSVINTDYLCPPVNAQSTYIILINVKVLQSAAWPRLVEGILTVKQTFICFSFFSLSLSASITASLSVRLSPSLCALYMWRWWKHLSGLISQAASLLDEHGLIFS